MPAVKVNLVIEQYADFSKVFIVKDAVTRQVVDLTGYTAHMVAKSLDGATELFNITPTVDGPNGKITISIAAAQTSGYTWTQGKYDLLALGATKLRILEGYVTVSPGVTTS